MRLIVREGGLKDVPFVRNLTVRSVKYGIPHTRRMPVAAVEKMAYQALSNMELALYSEDIKLLVAEDTDADRKVGFLLLKLNEFESTTGEPQTVIHDVAVEPDYWGKYVMDALVARAEEITRREGYIYIVGNITACNRRSLIYSTKRLHYEIERHQVVKVLL